MTWPRSNSYLDAISTFLPSLLSHMTETAISTGLTSDIMEKDNASFGKTASEQYDNTKEED